MLRKKQVMGNACLTSKELETFMRKNIFKSVFLFALVSFMMIFASCNGDMFGSKEPTDITISETLMEFETIGDVLGRNLQLSASVTLKDGSTSTDVKWSVPEDITAFKVNSTAKGVLTFQVLKAGTYVVTASAEYKGQKVKTADCVITIKDALVSLEIAKLGESAFDSTTLSVGNSLELVANYTPASTSQKNVQWTVSNMDIASVVEQPNGKAIITGKAAGTATVTVRSTDNSKISDSVKVIVQESGSQQKFGVRSIELTPGTGSVEVGKSLTLNAVVLDGNANEITTGKVDFTLTGAGATVSSSGRSAVVTAVKGGEVTLHASFTYDGATVTADVPITITGDVQSMTASSSFVNAQIGDTDTINISYNPTGTSRTGFNYVLSNQNVLVVTSQSDSGLSFRAVAEGRTTITFTSKYDTSIKASTVINVVKTLSESDRIQKVTLSSNTLSYYPPFAESEITASVYRRSDSGSVLVSELNTVTWESSDETIATIEVDNKDPNKAYITPVAPGTARIVARSVDNPEVSSTATVTVYGQLESMVPSITTLNIAVDKNDHVILNPYPSYAIYAKPVVSASNDNLSISLSQRISGDWGIDITAEKAGTTVLTVYAEGRQMCTINVNTYLTEAASVRNISLSETAVTLSQESDPYFITATPLDKNGEEIEKLVSFEPANSTSESVATIERIGETNNFYIKPANAGTCDYLFTVDGNTYASTRLHIEVGGSAVQGVEARQIQPKADSINVMKGNTYVMDLNVIPIGADVGHVFWSSSDASVASVSGDSTQGTVWAIAEGSATITATTNAGLTTSFVVNVSASASVTDTRISRIEITSGSDTSYIVTSSLRKYITLNAISYTADGQPITDTYTWTVEGSCVQSAQSSSDTSSFSVITKQFTSMSEPAVIRATSVLNPDVSALFRIYVAADTAMSADNPQILLDDSAITMEKDSKREIDFRILPVSYFGNINVEVSNPCVDVMLVGANKTLRIDARTPGVSIVTVTTGNASASMVVTVVDKAGKIDNSITGISLDRSYLSYDIAQKAPQTITATVYRNGIAVQNENIVWSVEDEDLAAVTVNGTKATVATFGKTGSTKITATAANNPAVFASCYVEIIDSTELARTLRYIMLSESSVSLKAGEKLTLTASGYPVSAFEEAELRWSSSNESVAVVSNGKITAFGEGVATITATAGELSDSCRVYVSDDSVQSQTPQNIVLSETLMNVSQEKMDKTFSITADIISATGAYITDRNVIWSVEDPNDAIEFNASYNAFYFSPRNAGIATVIASVDNIRTTAKIVVGASAVDSNALTSIRIYPSKLILKVGDTQDISAHTIPSTNEDNLSWVVSTPSNVELTPNGRKASLRAVRTGTSTITVFSAENPAISATMTVEVQSKEAAETGMVTGIVLDKSSISLDMSERDITTLKATVYVDGQPSDKEVSWTHDASLTPAIRMTAMGSRNNTVSIVKNAVGSGYITATSVDNPEFYVSCYVSVIDSATQAQTLTGAMLSSTAINIEEGSFHQLNVVTMPLDIDGVEILYSSSDSRVASVSETGLVTGLASGKADITAIVSRGTKAYTLKATVQVYERDEAIQAQPSAIRFSENSIYLSQDDMDTFKEITATVLNSSFEQITSANVYWEVEDPSVVNVVKSGNSINVFPLSAGRTTIKATYRNISNTILVVVGSPSSALAAKTTGITFGTSNVRMAVGDTKTLTPRVIPAGVEDSIAYSVDDENVISLEKNNDGTISVKAKGLGSATITAVSVNYPNISSKLDISVSATTANAITSIELDKSFIALTIGEKAVTELKATAYVNGKATKNVNLVWSLEGLTDAQLGLQARDSFGSSVYLNKKASGEGYVVCSSPDGSVSARCQVEITEIQNSVETVKYVKMSETLMNLSQEKMDKTYTITAGAYTADNRLVSRQVAWTVEDPDNAIVWEAGANTLSLSPRNAGTAVVTATTDNVSAKTRIIVGALNYADAQPETILINPSTLRLAAGAQHEVKATVLPVTDGSSVVWTTSAPGVATIDPNGNNAIVKGLSAGNAVISAHVLGTDIVESINVTVVSEMGPDSVSSVVLDKTSITLDLAEKNLTILKANVYKNNEISSGAVTWTLDSGLSDIITIQENIGTSANSIGIAKKTETGSGYITATSVDDPDFSASCFVQVIDTNEISMENLLAATLSSETISVGSGDTYQFSVQILPENLTGYDTYWASSDESIAKVDENGKLFAVSPGRATITASVVKNNRVINLYCQVSVYANVSDAVVPSVIKFTDNVVYLSQDNMDIGTQIEAKILDSNYSEMKYASVDSWTVEQNGSVISTLTSGNSVVVYPLSAGSATVTARYKNVEGSFLVIVGAPTSSVSPSIKGITLSSDSIIIGKGKSDTLTAYTVPSANNSQIGFAISDNEVLSATKEGNTVTVTGLKQGTASVQAVSLENPSITKTARITVVDEISNDTVTSIVLDKTHIALSIDDKALTQIRAKAYSGTREVEANIVWTLEGLTDSQLTVTAMDSRASVVNLTKKAAGNGYLVASTEDGSVYSRCLVEISQNASFSGIASRIILSQDMLNLSQERMDEYTMVSASVVDINGETLPNTVTWSVSNQKVARVAVNGNKAMVYPMSAGATYLTASSGSVSNSILVVVGASYLTNSEARAMLFSSNKVVIATGADMTVSASVMPVSATASSVLWSGGTNGVAHIASINGNSVTIHGDGAGSCTFTAINDNGLAAGTLQVVVKDPANITDNEPVYVTADKTAITLDINEKSSTTIKATVGNGDGSITGEAEWFVDPSLNGVVSYTDLGNNTISLVKQAAGSGYITAKASGDNSFSTSVYVEVIDSSDAGLTLRFINLSEHQLALKKGARTMLSVTGYPASTLAGRTIVWGSSDTTVAAVSNGSIYATGAGTATITATVEGTTISDSCQVTVYEDEVGVLAIRLDDSSVSMSVNEMYQLTYNVVPDMANEHLVWSSSNPSVVQVNRDGVLTAKAPGNATILVSDYTTSAFASVDVQVLSVAVTGSVTGISTNPSSLTIRRAASVRLQVYALPDSMNDTFSYGIADQTIAIVDEYFSTSTSVVVTGLKTGTTTLTITSDSNPSVSRDVRITVVPDITDVVTAVTATKPVVSTTVGSIVELGAKVFVDNKISDEKTLVWTAEGFADNTVVLTTVDSKGSSAVLSALKAGSGSIVATEPESGHFARFNVTIKDQEQTIPVSVSSVGLSSSVVYLSQEKGSEEVSAIIRGTDNSVLPGPVVWSCTDSSIFGLEFAGNTAVITPLAAGTAKLKASFGGVESEALVIVGSPTVVQEDSSMRSVVINPSSLILSPGATETLNAVVDPFGTEDTLTWVTSNPTVIAIEQNGRNAKVTALSTGKATVTAYASNSVVVKDSIDIEVKAFSNPDEVTSVKLSRNAVSLDLSENGGDVVLSAIVYKGGKASDSAVEWTLDNSLVGIVDVREEGNNTISITKRSVGAGYITATSVENPEFYASMRIEVRDSSDVPPSEIQLRSIILSTASVTIAKGETFSVGLSVIPENVSDYKQIWSTGDEAVASVDNTGKITAKGQGSTYVRVSVTKGSTIIEKTLNVKVTEESVVPSDFLVSDTELTIRINEAYTVNVVPVPTDAKLNLTWASSDITVAKVSQNGTITGIAAGNAIISVHDYANNIHKAITVQVLATPAENVRASFVRLSVQSVELSQTDESKDVTASVIGSDGYPLAGATVVWALDNESVASMVTDGNVATLTGLESGRTTLRAYYGMLSASASVYTGFVPGTDVATLDHITATPQVLTIQTGSEGNIEVTPYPAGLEINPVWQSENTSIASIASSFNGKSTALVNANAQGDTTITVRDSATEKRAQVKVRVRDDISTMITGITTDRQSLTLDVNNLKAVDITAKVFVGNTESLTEPVEWVFLDENGESPVQGIVVFTPTDTTGRTVSVRPIGTGAGRLKVSAVNDSEVWQSVYINVIDSTVISQHVTELRLEFDSLTMTKGSTRRFNAVTLPKGAFADVRWAVESQDPAGVASVDIYGNVSALSAGTAIVKAYLADNPSINDTVALTVTEATSGETASEYDIGSITITPATATLRQDDQYPTAFTARIFDTNGRELLTENVVWNTEGLGNIANVERTEGNTIYLTANDAGRGSLTAQRTSRDNTVISATAFVFSGIVDNGTTLSSFTFRDSSPVYLVAANNETKTLPLQYRPDIESVKGALWTLGNAEGFIETTGSDTGITVTAIAPTPENRNATITAVSTAKNANNQSLSADIEVKVVATEADLPAVTSISLDKTAIFLNIGDKADTMVTATAYNHSGKEVRDAVIHWSLANNDGTTVSITSNLGKTTGINKGNATGTVDLVATCGDVTATCHITIVDTVPFAGIALSSESFHLVPGGSTMVTVYGNPASMFTGEVETTVSGSEDCIEVNPTSDRTRFTITALEEGTATIRFSTIVDDIRYFADATVYVNSTETLGVHRIVLNPAYAFLTPGESTTLTANLYDKKGNPVNSSVQFYTTDGSVATVEASGNTATVTAHADGVTSIVARSADVEAQTYISVSSQPQDQDDRLKAIIPGMSNVTLAKNESISVNIATVPTNFAGAITAVSNRSNVATATVTGKTVTINAIGNGVANITLSSGSIMGTIAVSVTGESAPATIRFNKNAINLSQEPGSQDVVVASVYDANDTKLNTVVRDWSVDDSSVAMITDNTNGSVTVEPVNAGSTFVTARINNVSSSFRVSVNERITSATGPTTMTMDTPSLRVRVGESAVVGVLYQPTGLSETARAIRWTSTNPSIANIREFGTDKAIIDAIMAGSATITASSTTNEGVSASLELVIPDDGEGPQLSTYLISLDKTIVRMEKGSRVILTPTLLKDGEEIDASGVDWFFENNEEPQLLSFVTGAGLSSTAKASSVTVLSSETDTGFAYIVASYNGATARAQVEVADLDVPDETNIRSIVFSSNSMVMEVGESATFSTSILPAITGVTYTWNQAENGSNALADPDKPYVRFLAAKNGSVTLQALRTGKVDIIVSAQVNNLEPVTATTTLEILEEGAAEATYTYGSIALSTSSLSLAQGADATYITATLKDTEGNDTPDEIYGWRILHETGVELLSYNHYEASGNVSRLPYFCNVNAQLRSTFAELKGTGSGVIYTEASAELVKIDTPADIAQDFTVIGDDHRMLRFVPGKAGLYFIEAYGPTENGTQIKSRCIVYVSGLISGANFQSNYVHMIKGETQMLSVSLSPSSASIGRAPEWTVSSPIPETNGMENANVKLTEPGDRTVILTAKEVSETPTTVTYAVTDVNGNVTQTTTTVMVHDQSYGTGGIRQIAFPNQFVTLGFPYTAQTYKASAYYMDGSAAVDQEIIYGVEINNNGTWIKVPETMEIYDAYVIGPNNTRTPKAGASLLATYTTGNGGITIVPQNKGVFRVVASLNKDGVYFTSEMYVTIGGDSNRITPASSSVVLYTGGSAKIALSLDNPGYDGGLTVEVLSEQTADGYLIENDRIVATGETMRSVFRNNSATPEAMILGAKILITNEAVRSNYGNTDLSTFDDFIGKDNEEYAKVERILETFPRTAVVRVSTKDRQSYADINVTIRRLPESNTYPVAIKLSSDKIDLNPPFNTEQQIAATLLDQQGKETNGTILWYLYRIGESKLGSAMDKENHVTDNEIMDYYFSGDTMYYTPKQAGIYRLTVECAENPQLRTTSTLNILGDVTGIAASTGTNLTVAKNNSAEISAVFTPSNALARDVVFSLDIPSSDGKVSLAKPLDPDQVHSNDYIAIRIGGSTATVTGLAGTTGANVQRIRMIYPTAAYAAVMDKIIANWRNDLETDDVCLRYESTDSAGVATFGLYNTDGMAVTVDGLSKIEAYYCNVNVTVTVDKAIYAFSTSSNRTIDPSALENNKVAFDMVSASSSVNGSTVSPFSHWDWVECRIVGDESGQVYASSVPVTKMINGQTYSLYDMDGEGIANDYFDGTSWQYGYNGNNGRYYNHENVSYTLYGPMVDQASTNVVIKSGGKYYYVDKNFQRQEIDSTYVNTESVPAPLAIKAGDNSGRLDIDNGGTTWFFNLNTQGIGDETLRIVVRMRDDIAYAAKAGKDPVALYGYDNEAVQVNASNLSLTIGGKIRSLSTGTVIRENHGTTVSETLTTDIDQIKLFEGASLTMIPTFNPTNTHEKGITWEVRALDGGKIDDYITYSNSSTGRQFMITAKAFRSVSANDHRLVEIIARSTADPSVYCRYEIDIQTMVKALNFSATSLRQTNKNITDGIHSTPIYDVITGAESAMTESDADIYCFDTTDFAGGGGNVDAYYITYDPRPDYGYDFKIEVVDNTADGSTAVIGEIDTVGIAEGEKAFRFIPTGRSYQSYDNNGNGVGGYTVAYGDVKLRIYNEQINYSKEFTIHYQPAGFRIVKFIEETDEFDGPFDPTILSGSSGARLRNKMNRYWDYIWNENTKILNGIECLVLAPNESIDLNMAGILNEEFTNDAGAVFKYTYFVSYLNPDSLAAKTETGEWLNPDEDNPGQPLDVFNVKWEILDRRNGSPSENKAYVSIPDNNKNKVVVTAKNSYGTAYLKYTINYPVTDENGYVQYVESVDEESGKVVQIPQYVTLTGGIPIYIITDLNQSLLALIENALSEEIEGANVHVAALIPENISRAQREKWFGISSASKVQAPNEDMVLDEDYLFLGKAYASFYGDTLDTFPVGKVAVSSVTAAGAKLKTMKGADYEGLALEFGKSGGNSLIDQIWPKSESQLDSDAVPMGYAPYAPASLGCFRNSKSYRDINLYDIENFKWVISLKVDMDYLTKDQSTLADIFSSTDSFGNSFRSGLVGGDFSNAAIKALEINGINGESIGFKNLRVPNGCGLRLSNLSFTAPGQNENNNITN